MEALNQHFPVMIAIFCAGYLLIAFEHLLNINKVTSALMMGVLLWIFQFAHDSVSSTESMVHLSKHLSAVSQIIVFILGALIIVEIINSHKGFKIIVNHIRFRSKKVMVWTIGIITFFLSSALDNLTTTIVMVSIMQKIIDDTDDRLIIGGAIVIAANAGGAWTPIGDVTTTMLWIGDRVSTIKIMVDLLIPCLACFAVSTAALALFLHGDLPKPKAGSLDTKIEPFGLFVLILGLSLLIFVPIFKHLTGLPPFMGIIFGLSLLWIFTDIAHRTPERSHLRVSGILSKVDISGPLFFLGILLAISALEASGILAKMAVYINARIGNVTIIATVIGLASAVIDNIPLVAASMGMYSLADYPTDSAFWQLLAYCAGTGGSILIIGSAAGVVFMGIEKIDFFAYLRKISVPALLGYFAGILVYMAFQVL